MNVLVELYVIGSIRERCNMAIPYVRHASSVKSIGFPWRIQSFKVDLKIFPCRRCDRREHVLAEITAKTVTREARRGEDFAQWTAAVVQKPPAECRLALNKTHKGGTAIFE